MGHVTESIWSNNDVIIPMAEVSHIEKDKRPDYIGAITVVFKHSKWADSFSEYQPTAYLQKEEADKFIKDWCVYRHELELETLAD